MTKVIPDGSGPNAVLTRSLESICCCGGGLVGGDVENVISERSVFAEMQGACCTGYCTGCQPRIKRINGEPTNESFQSSVPDIVVPHERHESIWHRCRPGTGTNLVN